MAGSDLAGMRFSNVENRCFVVSAGAKIALKRFSRVLFNLMKEVRMPLIEVKIVLINSPVLVVQAGFGGEKRG